MFCSSRMTAGLLKEWRTRWLTWNSERQVGAVGSLPAYHGGKLLGLIGRTIPYVPASRQCNFLFGIFGGEFAKVFEVS